MHPQIFGQVYAVVALNQLLPQAAVAVVERVAVLMEGRKEESPSEEKAMKRKTKEEKDKALTLTQSKRLRFLQRNTINLIIQ
jgi:hypothetical protein